jgi:RNase H-fold protein (predicted Holliday junction resolvase)
MLAGVGLSRGRKKERSDAVAAQVVLAAWLEAQAAGGHDRGPEPLAG